MDLIVRNGLVVTASDTYRADIGIEGERIIQIGQALDGSGASREIDARGKYVFPGGVDPHTHLDTPGQGTVSADDYRSGTIAAACGGTTSIVNFCVQEKGQGIGASLAYYHRRAEGQAVVDYGFHAMVSDPTEAVFEEIPTLPGQG